MATKKEIDEELNFYRDKIEWTVLNIARLKSMGNYLETYSDGRSGLVRPNPNEVERYVKMFHENIEEYGSHMLSVMCKMDLPERK